MSNEIKEKIVLETKLAFESLIPKSSKRELEILEASLKENGCLEPLVVWNGVLIDGHQRYALCKKLNISFQVQNIDFASEDEAKIWIINNNLARRNLKNPQRCHIVMNLHSHYQQKARENQAGANNGSIDTAKELGKLAGVSKDTMTKFIEIFNSGNNEVIDDLFNGKLTINKAYQIIKGIDTDNNRTSVSVKHDEKDINKLQDKRKAVEEMLSLVDQLIESAKTKS